MADYARRITGNEQRSLEERVRRLETRRPLRGGAPDLAFGIEGPLTTARKFPWLWIAIDPGGDGVFPEEKKIIGFHGKIDSGSVTIHWEVDDVEIPGSDGHEIDTVGPNRLNLVTPYVFENDEEGYWFRPVLDAVTGTDTNVMLSCQPIFEVIPI